MDNWDAEFLDHFGGHDRDDVFGRSAVMAISLQGAFGRQTYPVSRFMTVSPEAIHHDLYGCGEVTADR